MRSTKGILRSRWFLLGFLVFLVAVIGGAGALVASRIPSVAQQLPPNAAPFIITISDPPNGSSYPANTHIPVRVKVVSAQAVAALELWADGELVDRKQMQNASDRKVVASSWSWQPGSIGQHTLLVRAIDVAGSTGESNPVRLNATEEVNPRVLYSTKQGDTLESVAQQLQTTPEELMARNPDLDPEAPLAEGQMLFAPLPFAVSKTASSKQPSAESGVSATGTGVSDKISQDPSKSGVAGPSASGASKTETSGLSPSGSVKVVSEAEANNLSFWGKKTLSPPSAPPTAPALMVSAEGCDAKLNITDKSKNEEGFFVYRLDPNSFTFERFATLAANGESVTLQFVDKGAAGHVEYYVTAFNAAGETSSNIASTDITDPACGRTQWVNPIPLKEQLRIEDGKLITSQPVDRVYYYLSTAPGGWTRIPDDPDTMIPPMQLGDLSKSGTKGEKLAEEAGRYDKRVFDLFGQSGVQDLAATSGNRSATIDVWGWSGGTLLRLGEHTATTETAQPESPEGWTTGYTELLMCGHIGECREGLGWVSETTIETEEADQVRTFSWRTSSEHATGALWQISTVSFGREFDPAPPGLVSTGALQGKGGDFAIDFSNLRPPGNQAGSSSPGMSQEALEVLLAQLSQGIEIDTTAAAAASSTYYVRVVPMAGTVQAGPPSEIKIVHRAPAKPQESSLAQLPPVPFKVEIVDYKTVTFPNPTLWGCVEITKNELYTGDVDTYSPSYWSMVKVGTVICPEVYHGEGEESWLESLWDFVTGAIDWVAELYEDIKNTVVDLVASTIPFCGDTCKAALKMGLNMALVAAGLPPSLPSFDQLTEMGEAYVISFVAEQVGAECSEDSLCQKAIKEGIDLLKEAAKAGGNNIACSDEEARRHGREPLCLPQGVVGMPIEGSMYAPASVQVKVTRLPEPANISDAIYSQYKLSVGVHGTNDTMVGQTLLLPVDTYIQYDAYIHSRTDNRPLKIDSPLQGRLFETQTINMPKIKPGASITIPFELNPADYWIPEHQQMIREAGGYVKYNDWFTLYLRGKATVGASTNCIPIPPQQCTVPPEAQDSKEYRNPDETHP
ncbi:MAG: LysM peptidoglycan-binding domain-containing protein [Chloroflexota bacterium]|jgi:LysM repeat protein